MIESTNAVRILVVDDQPIARDSICALLNTEPDMAVVALAQNGSEAIAQVKKWHPDIVLMDIALPQMDGIESCRRIAKTHPHSKVIFLTQYDKTDFIESAIIFGSNGYVVKTTKPEGLFQAIRTVYNGGYYFNQEITRDMFEVYRHSLEHKNISDVFHVLTKREQQIVKLIAEGQRSQQIADTLSIAMKTVSGHRDRIYRKLNLHNHSELVQYAIRKRLIHLDTD
jgi:two-component system nitrate/nitrite response regulator NarL